MAVNESGGMNANLAEGMTDGKYKKVVMNRGGEVETGTIRSRLDLADTWFGIHEENTKVLPDGRTSHTPDFFATVTRPLGQ